MKRPMNWESQQESSDVLSTSGCYVEGATNQLKGWRAGAGWDCMSYSYWLTPPLSKAGFL